jgi:hypothetical protein
VSKYTNSSIANVITMMTLARAQMDMRSSHKSHTLSRQAVGLDSSVRSCTGVIAKHLKALPSLRFLQLVSILLL